MMALVLPSFHHPVHPLLDSYARSGDRFPPSVSSLGNGSICHSIGRPAAPSLSPRAVSYALMTFADIRTQRATQMKLMIPLCTDDILFLSFFRGALSHCQERVKQAPEQRYGWDCRCDTTSFSRCVCVCAAICVWPAVTAWLQSLMLIAIQVLRQRVEEWKRDREKQTCDTGGE